MNDGSSTSPGAGPPVSAGTVLPYVAAGRRSPWTRRRTTAAVLLALLVAAGGWVYTERQSLDARARRLYWGWQCARHVTPPATVLVEHDPERAATVAARNSDYVLCGNLTPAPRNRIRLALYGAGPRYASYLPKAWREFSRVEPQSLNFSMPVNFNDPVAFLGERTSPSGRRRLVVIAGHYRNALRLPDDLPALSVPMPHLFESLPQSGWQMPFARSGRYVPARLSPGVADPKDPSHLSIDFEVLDGYSDPPRVVRRGTVDAYLQDDGTLRTSLRDPASTAGL